MEIGNQIKQLRLRRGITQEAMAQHFGLSPQAISKWERGTAAPDIELLPQLSAYFGVTIDELFALSDDIRIERIQNMIWDVRYLNPTDVENERNFLLEKARREPGNGRPHELLADMENHLAREHRALAAEYAMEALRRDPELTEANAELVAAMDGKMPDWNASNHNALIRYYKESIQKNPGNWRGILWLMDQLIDDNRLTEASEYCDRLAMINDTYRVSMYRGLIAWHGGDRTRAAEIWRTMCETYPDDWRLWLNMADVMARSGEYEQAKEYYRKSLSLTPVPRVVDALESIAQICEIQGDFAGAVSALEEELELMDTDWHFTTGETADIVRREIARLRAAAQESTCPV